jgi:hypothetical protein
MPHPGGAGYLQDMSLCDPGPQGRTARGTRNLAGKEAANGVRSVGAGMGERGAGRAIEAA